MPYFYPQKKLSGVKLNFVLQLSGGDIISVAIVENEKVVAKLLAMYLDRYGGKNGNISVIIR